MLNEAYVQGCEVALEKIAEFAGEEFIEKMAGKGPGFFSKMWGGMKAGGKRAGDAVATPFSKGRTEAAMHYKASAKPESRLAKKMEGKSDEDIKKMVGRRVWAARGGAASVGAAGVGGGIYAGTRDNKRR